MFYSYLLAEKHNVKLYVGSDSNPIDLTDPMDSLLVGLLSEISSYDRLTT